MVSLFRKKKDGSSLVSVIIGVFFLTAIGLLILTVATRYAVSVYVDRSTSENFYETESVLEEVRTGLLEYAQDASASAYEDVLAKYTTTTGSMKETYARQYLGGLAAKLTGLSYVWDDGKLGMLQACELSNVKTLSTRPDSVTTLPGSNLAFVINKDAEGEYSLTLKNLMVDYTNDANYRSTIQSDLVFTVPDFKFEGDSTLDEIKKYIVISDDSLKVTQNENAPGVTFTGNVYTGNEDMGICIDTQNEAVFRSETIISRGSIAALSGSHVSLTGENSAGNLWVKDIVLKANASEGSTLSTGFEMNENAYVANDLDIEDNNAVVSISGKYYGYSYNEENTKETVTARSDHSSAILINGLNTTLKTDGLDKLILAGRTFVSRSEKDGSSRISDIMMGESLAVKSNQLAYLLPDKYIAVGHNPVVDGEDMTIYKEELLASDIGSYLDPMEPYTANYNNEGMYAFFYLKFKDEKNANQYFKAYYSGNTEEVGESLSNKEQLDEKAQSYIATTDDTGMKLSPSLYLIAGNIIHNYYAADGSSIQSDNYYDNSGEPKVELLEDGRKIGQDYVAKQLTLLTSGGTGSMRYLTTDPNAAAPALVADRIIDFSKVTADMTKPETAEETAALGGKIYVTAGDYVVNGTITKGLIIAGGNVEVQNDFTGLILAKGKVTTTRSNLKLTADMVLVGNLLDYAKKDDDLARIFYAWNGAEKQNSIDMTECISYQNWEKNTY